jgi:hypothetical protein
MDLEQASKSRSPIQDAHEVPLRPVATNSSLSGKHFISMFRKDADLSELAICGPSSPIG